MMSTAALVRPLRCAKVVSAIPIRGNATCLSRRSFVTSFPRLNTLSSKSTTEEVSKGSEGLHNKDLGKQASKEVHVDRTGKVIGDWVLFHPVYTKDELDSVDIMHHQPTKVSDKFASSLVWLARKGFDIVSGYRHKEIPPNSNMSYEELLKGGYIMSEKSWLSRILFLESIAGVPGMVAATVRHLQSLRLMRRDSGWIHTLLEEAENERMHLMTFMSLRKNSIFFRALILGAQGVFYNAFFLAYLVSPRTCHRFVGYLEEEAVITYSRCIEDMKLGRIPEWSNMDAPAIAKEYWRLAPDAKMIDVVYAVRSDETTHRFVNHSLANLKNTDVNPFAFREPDMHVKGKKLEFKREESAQYVEESRDLVDKGKQVHAHIHS